MMNLTQQGDVHILTMDDGEGNAFDFEFLAGMHETLDVIEAKRGGPGALVVTGTGKAFW